MLVLLTQVFTVFAAVTADGASPFATSLLKKVLDARQRPRHEASDANPSSFLSESLDETLTYKMPCVRPRWDQTLCKMDPNSEESILGSGSNYRTGTATMRRSVAVPLGVDFTQPMHNGKEDNKYWQLPTNGDTMDKKGKNWFEEEIGTMKEELGTNLDVVEALDKDAKKRERERRSGDDSGSTGPSRWRGEVNNYWEKVKNKADTMEETALVEAEKLDDLTSLVTQRANKQQKRVLQEFALISAGKLDIDGVEVDVQSNGTMAKLIEILREKALRRLDRLGFELKDAELEFNEGAKDLELEAYPEIEEYYKDLEDQAREAYQGLAGDVASSDAALTSANRMVSQLQAYGMESAVPRIAELREYLEKGIKQELPDAVAHWSKDASAQLDAYLQEEKDKLDDLAQQYELKVEEEEKNRFGDGFEEPGRIKTVNDKWTADQQDLTRALIERTNGVIREYTGLLNDTNEPAMEVEKAAKAALDLKALLSDKTADEGGEIALQINRVQAKMADLPELGSWSSHISSMKSAMDAEVEGSGGIVPEAKSNAIAFMLARLENVSHTYDGVMSKVLGKLRTYDEKVQPKFQLLKDKLHEIDDRISVMVNWDQDNKTDLEEKLSEARTLLADYSSSSTQLYTDKNKKYKGDLKSPANFFNSKLQSPENPDLVPFDDVRRGDGERRLTYLNDATDIFEEAKTMQKKAIEKKIHEATAFLTAQRQLASELHSSIQDDLSGAEQTARVQNQALNRLRVGAAEAQLSERKLRNKIDTEATEMQNTTADAAGKLREVAVEVNAGTVRNVQHEFAVAAQSVDKEFSRLAPRRAYALNAVEDRLQDAGDTSLQPISERQQELLSTGVKVGNLQVAMEKQVEKSVQNIATISKEMAFLRKKQGEAKPKMLKRVRRAFGAMRSGLEEQIRDGIHTTVIKGQRTIDKAKALAHELEKAGGFSTSKMQLGRADAAMQLAEDAERKSRAARERAKVAEEAAAGTTTDAIDRVAELANSETGMGKDDLKELESLLSNAQQNLEAQSMRADAASQKLRYDATLKGERAERSITAKGWTADSDLRNAEQGIVGMAGKAADIVGLEAGLMLPDDGGLEDASDMIEGIVGMEGDTFKRLAANQHRQLSVEQRELGAIVGAVKDLANSFSEEFDEATAALPHAAKDAASAFGAVSADAAAATDAELAEAETVGNLRMPGVAATVRATDQLADYAEGVESKAEAGMEKLVKSQFQSAKEEHEAEIDDLGALVSKLHGVFEPMPQLTGVMEQIKDIDFDATHHLATLQQHEGSKKARVDGVLDGVAPVEDAASRIGGALEATQPHRPVVPGMPVPNLAKGTDDLRVRMSGEAAAASHVVDQDLQKTSQEFSETSGALLKKQGGLRDQIAKDVQDGAADESAVTSELRSKSTGDLSKAQGAGSTLGEVYVNVEQQVDTLQEKIDRLYDSAVAFGKVHAADIKPRAELLAAAQALENLEAHKKAVKDGTKASDTKSGTSVLEQTVSQDAGVLSAEAAGDVKLTAQERTMDRDLQWLIARDKEPVDSGNRGNATIHWKSRSRM